MKVRYSLILFLLLLFFTVGCTTQRLNQFGKFAEAGKGYSEAIIALTDEAGNVAIDADSHVLIIARSGLSDSSTRATLYNAKTEVLKDLLTEFRKFRKHNELLKKYFIALNNIATSDASSEISEGTGKIVDELKKISPSIADAQIGDASVRDFTTKISALSVKVYQKKVLEDELEKNATLIAQELDLQHAFLSALAEDMEADLTVILNAKEYDEVSKPYVDKGKLPKSWIKNRRTLLSSYVVMGSVENAKKAAETLGKAFKKLVNNEIEAADFDDLFEDINSMLDLIELVKGNTEE